MKKLDERSFRNDALSGKYAWCVNDRARIAMCIARRCAIITHLKKVKSQFENEIEHCKMLLNVINTELETIRKRREEVSMPLQQRMEE